MINLCPKEQCTGCFACLNSCMQNAITINNDECGFIYPSINRNKCIECHQCERVCPIINKKCIKNDEKNWGFFDGYSLNNSILTHSTSGGIAYSLSRSIIKNGGIVYGVAWDLDNKGTHYERIDNENDFKKIQGTKYIEGSKNFYISARKDLNQKKEVLIFGTPCIIGGFVSFLDKEYSNLFLCELVCHGITTAKAFKEYEHKYFYNMPVDSVNFRFKKNNKWDPPYIIIRSGNKTHLEMTFGSTFGFAFLNMSRDSCYSCTFKGDNSFADIQIGDYWGANSFNSDYNEKGMSVIITKSMKGMTLLKRTDDFKYEKAEKITIYENNPYIFKSVIKNVENKAFRRNFIEKGLEMACLKDARFKTNKRNLRKISIKNKIKCIISFNWIKHKANE